ncbi:MAG: hypothetical protein SAJ37_19550 [Oscillatoria sp. PMC 1068.18]|nr:hypothetical protein [Oscillatoria sp. PMC 1076.18]MEC4990933.1 hypothetical protein [Oscillatoria sp. PMC 1068.18]
MTNLPQEPENIDPDFNKQVERLHRLTVYGRWLVVGLSWLIFAPLGIWGLREEISLWLEHFTWAAVRYGLAYNRLAAVCLAFCLGMTTAVLIWQSRNILFGLPVQERRQLEKKVRRIQAKGPTHPLWKWVCQSRL